MKVVSNSSVLISLSAIGQLDLLHKEFPEGVLIPRAVWQEVVATGQGRSGARSRLCILIQIVVSDRIWPLRADLDAGEAEALVLAR